MTITWLYTGKPGTALTGTVLQDTGRYYRVQITATERKSHQKMIGEQHMVSKKIAQVQR